MNHKFVRSFAHSATPRHSRISITTSSLGEIERPRCPNDGKARHRTGDERSRTRIYRFYSPNTRRVGSSRGSSAMLVFDSRTSSANGACGRRQRCQAARTSYLRSPTRWAKGAAGRLRRRSSRKNFQSFPKPLCDAPDNYSMEVRSDPFESAKSHFFDTSSWGAFCDVTLTLKQARLPDRGGWVKIDDYRCRRAFRHFMNLLNRSVYGAAFRRYGKGLRVLPVLEKGDVRARALRSWERGTSGRWHIHCAIELPLHLDGIDLENQIRDCWAKVEWGYSRILVRDGANAGWINYMLKDRQKSEFDGFVDCIIIESLHNPFVDA